MVLEGSEADDDSKFLGRGDGAPPHESALAKRSEVPVGWWKVEQTLSSGRVIPHYHGPDGMYSRSLVGSWETAATAIKVGDRVEIIWSSKTRSEAGHYFAVYVMERSSSNVFLVHFHYEVDSKELWHNLRCEHWKPGSE